MDQITEAAICDIIDKNIAHKKTFTAFDITMDVQQALKAQNAFDPEKHRHRYLRSDIHKIMANKVNAGQFTKTLEPVNPKVSAFFYRLVDSNINSVIDGNHTIIMSDSNALINNDIGRSVDERGSLTVPASLLRSIGLNPDDSAYVYLKNGNLRVSKQEINSSVEIFRIYSVNSSGNVRITKSLLDYIESSNDKYDFKVEDQEIVVTGIYP